MNRFILRYGFLAGGIVMASGLTLWPFTANPAEAGVLGMIIGFAFMSVAMSFVFFGVRAYRTSLGGTVTFLAALRCGLAIAGIASLIYVLAWEVAHANLFPDFAQNYGKVMIRDFEATLPSAEALAAKQAEVAEFVSSYKLWYVRMGYTLMEIAPVGILASVLAAAFLRKNARTE
jgi:hypothetical protein